MSNYIRTLLRFEKERAARRKSEDPDAASRSAEEEKVGIPARSGFWTTADPEPLETTVPDVSVPIAEATEKAAQERLPQSLELPPPQPIDVPIVPIDLPFEVGVGPATEEKVEAPKAPKSKPKEETVEVQWWPEPTNTPAAKPARKGWLASLASLVPFWERRRRQGAARASAHTSTAYAQLLDSLRAVETSFSAPGVVLASAGSADAVAPVLEGLRGQARRKGLRLLVAELVVSKGGRILGGRDPACTAELLEFNRTVTEDTVRNWFERAVTGQDLLIVEAPPLSQSVDAGLLARACDGLALVVEPQRTSRHEFETAVERSKASGSFLLGMVMNQHTHWLPHFLRTFFNSYPRLVRQPPRARSR